MNHFRYYAIILFVSVLPLASLFLTQKLIHTHDGLVHLPRIAAYYKALLDGQFPVRYAGELNYGYGMPLFNFIYQFPYIVSSFFLLFGVGLVNAFKLTLALSYLLSGVFMYAFAKAYFKNEKTALLVAIFYQFAPFRFVELLIRASLGEVFAYTFLPLVLFALYKYVATNKLRYFILTALSTALLILSHNAISLVFFGIIFCFCITFVKSKVVLLQSGIALLLGLMLASFYWIPAILEHKYTYGDLFMKDLYRSHFVPLQNFFIPNITNSKTLQTEGISVQLGIFHVIALVLSIRLLFLRKTEKYIKKIIFFSLGCLIVAFFFMQPMSIFLWERISFLRQFQFPWRFLSVVVFSTSILSVGFVANRFTDSKWMYILLIFLTIISTIFYWKPSLGLDTINEAYYWKFPLNTTYYGETDVIWSAGPAKSYPQRRIDIIGGKGSIQNIVKKSQLHTYRVSAQTPLQIVDKTQYFPGWKVLANNKPVDIEFQDPNWRGQITYRLPRGNYNVEVIFGESPLRSIADTISVVALFTLLSLCLTKKKSL